MASLEIGSLQESFRRQTRQWWNLLLLNITVLIIQNQLWHIIVIYVLLPILSEQTVFARCKCLIEHHIQGMVIFKTMLSGVVVSDGIFHTSFVEGIACVGYRLSVEASYISTIRRLNLLLHPHYDLAP